MNKRDYFAAQAMQSIIAKAPLTLTSSVDEDEDIEVFMKAVARGAYAYADAMMTEREEWN